jgi:hypothetical protein
MQGNYPVLKPTFVSADEGLLARRRRWSGLENPVPAITFVACEEAEPPGGWVTLDQVEEVGQNRPVVPVIEMSDEVRVD